MEKITVRTIRHCFLLLLLLTGIWGCMRNLNKLYLKDVAKFAVSEMSKQSHKKLVFQRILNGDGESQMVQGFNYLLRIEVNDESSPFIVIKYECSVYSGNLIKRMQFKGCDQFWILGGWNPIGDLKETFLKEVAEFAVSEISKQRNRKLVFQGVLKGEKQVVQGFNYLLDIQWGKYYLLVHNPL